MSVKVYGASDDLIEVEGDIDEEFNPKNDEDPSYLAFADGTVLRVTYDGMWHIQRIAVGSATYLKHEATNEDDDYSDIVTLTGDGPLKWVVFGPRFEASA
jgi:hypothetical protein